MIGNVGPLFRFLVAHYSITSITSVFKKFMNEGGGVKGVIKIGFTFKFWYVSKVEGGFLGLQVYGVEH
jgi:hypothetical protein